MNRAEIDEPRRQELVEALLEVFAVAREAAVADADRFVADCLREGLTESPPAGT